MKNFSVKELEHIFANDFQSPIFPILEHKYFSIKQYNKAEKVCDIGLKYDKNNFVGKYILSKIYLVNNKVLKAEKLLKEIVLKDQNNFNALLTLIEVQKKIKRSSNSINKIVNQAYNVLPDNKLVSKMYRANTRNRKKTKNNKNKAVKDNAIIHINEKMATKTMYSLMIKQSNYDIAKKILKIMIINKKHKTFAKKELKKLGE